MLQLDDLHTYYGDSHILHGASLEVGDRSVVALSGRNGVGKTTTLHSIIGLSPPRRGVVRFKAADITGLKPYKIARLGIALVPQGRRLFQSLSVKETLAVAACVRGKSMQGWNQERIFSLFSTLRARQGARAKTLSGGEMQMLAIARALMTNPDLLLMDEPTEGLAPLLIQQIKDVISKIGAEKETSILLVEQNLQVILDVAAYVYVMSKGKVVYESNPEDLMKNEEAKTRYLGVGSA